MTPNTRTDTLRIALLLAACIGSPSLTEQGTARAENLIRSAAVTASTMASKEPGGKYGVLRLCDGDARTRWASKRNSQLPQWIKAEWEEPVTLDTVTIDAYWRLDFYGVWKKVEVELSDGATAEYGFKDRGSDSTVIRFDEPHTVSWAVLRVVEVVEPKANLGICELGFYLDPHRRIGPPKKLIKPKARSELKPEGRPRHPIVYVTPEDVQRARRNAERTAWGKTEKESVLTQAEQWLEHDEAYWLQFLPEPGACYACGWTGCPVCGSRFADCRWDLPRKTKCRKGHLLPDAAHPDDGAGYVAKDERVHYPVGFWNRWVTERWTRRALPALAHAYALTGDERYAERAAFFFDALASIYAESTNGPWDWPRPGSRQTGRFGRPGYQASRTLVVLVDAYDLIYSSSALGKPSLRPRLEKTFPPGPTPEQRLRSKKDVKAQSWEGMTRRENIDINMMQDAGHYCYSHCFKSALHNGHADYLRGALAVGALLGIPEYVRHSVESHVSIYAMLANNCDRDGRYHETSLSYALHARDLYLTFVEPLRNWRSPRYPHGIDLFADPRMRSFYYLPELVMETAGHRPNFGDCTPDNRFALQPSAPYSVKDHIYAERLYAGCTGKAKEEFAGILRFLSKGDVPKARAGSPIKRWLLYHAEPVPSSEGASLAPELERRVFGSWFLGQKGIAILRDGREADAQAALLRYGPSLNHGDLDDLGLIYYGRGWQLTYDIGYGLASTHCQVGWASQTVSHSIVTVNETSQRGPGSGGNLYLFASLPSIKIMEADSPVSYSAQGVTQYRRTVALVGSGRDQYLIDVFRVRGGDQHDYGIGVQSHDAEFHGIHLSPEEEGSLAGKEHAWGKRVGPDGDVIGYPNKPYWNPPPQNGYGFFYDMRRAPAREPFHVDFKIGGQNRATVRIHALPERDTEAILAKAPGLYPGNRKATYLIARRRAPNGASLASVFASVLEPYASLIRTEGTPSQDLLSKVIEQQGEVRLIPAYGVVFLKGSGDGSFMTFGIHLDRDGEYEIAAQMLRSPSYGTVRLLVDGARVGEPFTGTHVSVSGPMRVLFGRRRLAAGAHRFRFEMVDGQSQRVGVSSLIVQPWSDRPASLPLEPRPILTMAERVTVTTEASDIAPIGIHVRRHDRDEYLFSASTEDSIRRASIAAGPITWRGAALFVACRGSKVETVATHGAWDTTVAGRRYGPDRGIWTGKVIALSYDERRVEVDAAVPASIRADGIYFSNPGYSRNTAYRIYGTERTPRGTRIDLGPQPMLLGQGRVHQIGLDNVVFSDIPHDYARSVVGGKNSRFFDGKLVTNGRGALTRLKRIVSDSPMQLAVDSTDGFGDGDTLYYYDVQVGDTFAIPTAWERGR